jgi:Zn-dependent protease
VIELPKISPPASELPRNCPHCGAAISLGAVVCQQCQGLVHSEELLRLSTAAKNQEEEGKTTEARDTWMRALALLPRDSTQAQWVIDHVKSLPSAPAPSSKPNWAARLGPLAPIAIFLAKSKALLFAIFKLKFLLSLGAFVALYWSLYGWKFGLGFVALIFLHEMGHYLDIRRRGLPADMPVFLPGLGAYVRWQALGVTRTTQAAISLAGPMAGLLGTAVCAGLFFRSGYGLWAALGRSGAVLNVLNLIPIWVLDGSKAASALVKSERAILLAACLLIWLFFGQGLFFLVAAGVTYRLFTKDFAPMPSHATLAYYLVLLVAYGAFLRLLPA